MIYLIIKDAWYFISKIPKRLLYRMKRYCLIGIKGIGKTTLIKSILSKISGIDYLIGSNILRQLVGPEFDNFDHFPEERKKFFREQSILSMIERQNKLKKDILVDGHTSLYNPNSGVAECVFTELDCKFFTDFILFELDAELILNRRKKDKTKKRIIDLEIIRQELKVERDVSHKISEEYGIQIHYLNERNEIDQKKKLLKILKSE